MPDYTVHTQADIKKMLKTLKIKSVKELFKNIPASLKAKTLKIDKGKSQLEVINELTGIAAKNKVYDCIMLGAGAYNHYIPPVVTHLSEREEFVTAYTPYQAEMSQGILQSIFEYQTMIANLTGMDISNASMYDGATAAAEAVIMCLDKNSDNIVVSENINPMTLKVFRTHLEPLRINIIQAGGKGKTSAKAILDAVNESTAAVYIEQPNFFGVIEDAAGTGALIKQTKAKYIMGVNPIAMGLLDSPGECGADIAVGEGQPLGIPLSFGGPYLGFLAAKDKLIRKMPGRIVGETVDTLGRRAYVLTLQAREQHIRREKALSNICSNQALCALKAAIYLAANGPRGLSEVAAQCVSKAHYAKDKFISTGVMSEIYPYEFFHEFPLKCAAPADKILKALAKKGILGGLKLDDFTILWCITEMVTKKDIDRAAGIIKGVKNETDI
ncbi:MAG: aminomethyl-transferring glycine dehydrogenase subunit GcvPA [Christensenellales bacterium]|jgi:glycine dehydrogenase subunit 1